MSRSNAITWLRATAGAVALFAACAPALAAEEPPHSAELDAMIVKEAQRHGVPESLVRRVVMRESRYNPHARNHRYWGLMQISYPTARSMGFKGTPQELLNPLVNLTYAVPYLANAFITAGKREDAAIRLYASGYYDTARHRGLLGSMRTADSAPAVGFHNDVQQVAAAEAQSTGIFGALLNPFDSSPAPTAAAYAATAPQDAPAQIAAAQDAPAPASPVSDQGTSAASASRGRHDKGKGGETNMVANAAGKAEPPKKWMHDGGVTILARGEQAGNHKAAKAEVSDEHASRRVAHRTHKNTQFAALDAPASAQAYAADTSAPVASSQSAIVNAIVPAGDASVQGTEPQQQSYPAAPAGMQEATAAAVDTETKHKASSKRKGHRYAAKHHAVLARAESDPAKPSEAAGAAPTEATATAQP